MNPVKISHNTKLVAPSTPKSSKKRQATPDQPTDQYTACNRLQRHEDFCLSEKKRDRIAKDLHKMS